VHSKQDFKDNEGFSDYQEITSFSDDSVDDINARKSGQGSYIAISAILIAKVFIL